MTSGDVLSCLISLDRISLNICQNILVFVAIFCYYYSVFQCGEKGHYANRCHKGLLAFLSNTAYLAHEQREKDEKEAR